MFSVIFPRHEKCMMNKIGINLSCQNYTFCDENQTQIDYSDNCFLLVRAGNLLSEIFTTDART